MFVDLSSEASWIYFVEPSPPFYGNKLTPHITRNNTVRGSFLTRTPTSPGRSTVDRQRHLPETAKAYYNLHRLCGSRDGRLFHLLWKGLERAKHFYLPNWAWYPQPFTSTQMPKTYTKFT